MRLAPLGVVAEKLRSRSPEVRAVALAHAKGHAANAAGIAAYIVSMFEDEAVAERAVEALRAIGSVAADATAPLVGLLDAGKAPERLARRALAGLESIGPGAWPALPMLERLYAGPLQREVLSAMAAIAPNAPKVAERVTEAVFSADAAVAAVAADALKAGGPIDAAVVQLRLRAFSFSRAKREGAHRALPLLARLAPAPVSLLMRELWNGSKPKAALAAAAAELPAALVPKDLQSLRGPAAEAKPVAATPAPAPTGEEDYPEFPAEDEAPKPGRLEPASDAPPLDGELSHGLQLLGRSLTARPADLAEALQTYFLRQQAEGQPAPDDASVQGLAAVWAHCLSTAYQWGWARYVRAEERTLVLASPQGGQMVFPAAWIRRQLRKKEPTVVQQFNGLAEAAPAGAEPTAVW